MVLNKLVSSANNLKRLLEFEWMLARSERLAVMASV